MNKKFSHDEGLTLIELLITLAVIAIVFAIAVPVFSNVLAGAQTSADTAQAAALSSFHDEYASTTLAFANGVTTATLNGVVIASIKGDATSAGAPAAPVAPAVVTYNVGVDFGSYTYMGMASTSHASSNPVMMGGGNGAFQFGNPTAALKTAVLALKAGDTVTMNGTDYTVRSNFGMTGYTTVDDQTGSGGPLYLFVSGSPTGDITTFKIAPAAPVVPGAAVTYTSANTDFYTSSMQGIVSQFDMTTMQSTAQLRIGRPMSGPMNSALQTKLLALHAGSTIVVNGTTYHVTSVEDQLSMNMQIVVSTSDAAAGGGMGMGTPITSITL